MEETTQISLPESLVKEVKNEKKLAGYKNTGEFIRHILRMWKTKRLGEELRRDRKKFEANKGKELSSLSDL